MWTGQVAKQVGVNMQTLRYYERRGILPEPPRSPAGYRDYPASAIGLLRFVKRAQELGFSLADIEELLQLADGRPVSCARTRAVAEARAADLDRRIADMQRMRDRLGELVTICQGPRAGRSCRVLARAVENTDEPAHGMLRSDDQLCACPDAPTGLR